MINLMLNFFAIVTGMVKIPTCSGQDISPTTLNPIAFSFFLIFWFGEYSITSKPSFLILSRFLLPMGDKSHVVELTHNGFNPYS